MHRRQEDGSAAGRNTRRNTRRSTRQNKRQWRNIFFQNTLTLPPHAPLVLPTQFVEDHATKFNAIATLENVENNKMWTVKIGVEFPGNRPENPPLVFLHGRGWGAFTIANDLAIGDQLTFALVAQTEFHVSILRGGGNSSLSVEKKKRSQKPIPKRRKTNPAPQLGCRIPTNGCEGSAEVTRTGTLLAKEAAKEAGVVAEAPDPSPSPSGMNLHGFEAIIPPEECLICQLAAMTKLAGAGFHTILNK